MNAIASVPESRSRWLMPILMATYACNFVDRTIVNILQQPIKVELGLTDAQLGLLSGTAFAIFYSLLGVFVSRLAEHGDRVKLLSICIILWSFFTLLCGLASSFIHLLALRVGVAVGEAGATPTCHSIISDSYSTQRRVGAMATFHVGSTIGAVIGALIGAFVGQAWGWRWAFAVAGAPGLLIATLAYFTIHEPRRRQPTQPHDVPPAMAVIRTLCSKSTFRHLAAGITMLFFVSYSLFAFITPHLMRSFDLPLKSAGVIGGVGGAVMVGVGGIAGGFTAQRLAVKDRRWMMWIIAASMIVALPVGFLTFTTSDLSVATFGFLSLAFFLGTFQGPLFGTVHSLVLPRMRATASATTLIPVTLIGLGLGPLLLGAASDYLAKLSFREGDYATCGAGSLVEACRAASASGLRYAMLAYLVFLLWAAVHFVLAGRSIRKEVLD